MVSVHPPARKTNSMGARKDKGPKFVPYEPYKVNNMNEFNLTETSLICNFAINIICECYLNNIIGIIQTCTLPYYKAAVTPMMAEGGGKKKAPSRNLRSAKLGDAEEEAESQKCDAMPELVLQGELQEQTKVSFLFSTIVLLI